MGLACRGARSRGYVPVTRATSTTGITTSSRRAESRRGEEEESPVRNEPVFSARDTRLFLSPSLSLSSFPSGSKRRASLSPSSSRSIAERRRSRRFSRKAAVPRDGEPDPRPRWPPRSRLSAVVVIDKYSPVGAYISRFILFSIRFYPRWYCSRSATSLR